MCAFFDVSFSTTNYSTTNYSDSHFTLFLHSLECLVLAPEHEILPLTAISCELSMRWKDPGHFASKIDLYGLDNSIHKITSNRARHVAGKIPHNHCDRALTAQTFSVVLLDSCIVAHALQAVAAYSVHHSHRHAMSCDTFLHFIEVYEQNVLWQRSVNLTCTPVENVHVL